MGDRDEATMVDNAEDRGLVPGEVLELLDERAEVQRWVEKLSDLESEASPAVYNKVLTDYRERLTGFSERLAAHRGAVETSLDEVRERLARLAQERAERVAALEEAKLRFTVGEYAEKDWERHRETDGQAVAELEENLGAENEARQELERILSELPDASGRRRPSWMPVGDDAGIPPRSPDADDLDSSAGAAATPAAAYVVEPGDEDLASESGDEGLASESGDEDLASEPGDADLARVRGEEEEAERPGTATVSGPEMEAPDDVNELAARSVKAPEVDPTGAGGSREAGLSGMAGMTGAAGMIEGESRTGESPPEDASYLDELAFLESLTLDDTERFDAVSAMLEEGEEKGNDDEEERPH